MPQRLFDSYIFYIILTLATFICGYVIGSLVKFRQAQKDSAPHTLDDLIDEEPTIEEKPSRLVEGVDYIDVPLKNGQPISNQTISERARTKPQAGIETRLGAIKRPSAEELEKRKNPVLKETEDAMRETLKAIPELNSDEESGANPIISTNDPLLTEEEIPQVK